MYFFNILIVKNPYLYIMYMFTIYVCMIIVYTATLLMCLFTGITSSLVPHLLPTHQNYKLTCSTFLMITTLYSATH